MKHISEELIKEHEGILMALNVLESMVNKLKKQSDINIEHLSKMVTFFKLFADKCHHGKEEGMLFPLMEKYGIPNKNGPINQMLVEHVEGRLYIKEMADALKEVQFNRLKFIDGAVNYIDLLRKHIEKENHILFPLGDKVIPEDIQISLARSFEVYEDEVMGQGVHEEQHGMLDEFTNLYLNKEA